MHDSDGRLDLDDLGTVIERAAALDVREVLADDHGRSWRERLDDAGVTAWVRRHRVVLGAGAAAVLLVGAGGTTYLRSRPPPLDPDLQVAVEPAVPSTYTTDSGDQYLFDVPGIYELEHGVRRTALDLRGATADDPSTYRLLGISGPGVRASMVLARSRSSVQYVTGGNDVDFVLDCYDPAVLTAQADQYTATIERTDAWGRSTVGTVVLPWIGDNDLAGNVRGNCLTQWADSGFAVDGLVVRADPARHSVVADVGLRSTLPAAVIATVQPPGGYPAVTLDAPPVELAPLGTARARMTLQVHDCARPTAASVAELPEVGEMQYPGQYSGERQARAGFYLVVQPASDAGNQTTAPVRWSRDQQRQVDAALTAACAGAPATSLRLASSVAATDQTGTSVRMTWEVGTTGRSVAMGAPTTQPYVDGALDIRGGAAQVRSGRAVLTTVWTIDCSPGYVEPPTLQAVVTTPGGTYPFQARVTSGALARTVARGCTSIPLDQLAGMGWDPQPGSA